MKENFFIIIWWEQIFIPVFLKKIPERTYFFLRTVTNRRNRIYFRNNILISIKWFIYSDGQGWIFYSPPKTSAAD